MGTFLNSLSDRARRLTDAYRTGVEITEQLRVGAALSLSIAGSAIRTEFLNDAYPSWHPAPDSFSGMLRLFIYCKITGESYRTVAKYQELAEPFGLNIFPTSPCCREHGANASTTVFASSFRLPPTSSSKRSTTAISQLLPFAEIRGCRRAESFHRVGPNEAETFCRRYSRRWQIENEYKSIKGDFLTKTSSKDYRVRLFYFVFAVLLYNIWRLADFLLKAGVDGEIDYSPVLTAGECVELICSALIPAD